MDLGLCTGETFLIKIYFVYLEKVSKHKGKALILKGYFARTPHCIQCISRISKAWDKIQPKAGRSWTCTCINNARLPHSRDPHVPGDSTIPAVLFGKSSPCFWQACHWQWSLQDYGEQELSAQNWPIPIWLWSKWVYHTIITVPV